MISYPEDISLKHRAMYMRIANAVSASGTCGRAQVGAVLVKNSCVIGTGYNGSAKGDGHCDDMGHIMESGHCIRTVHAEENAILNAAKNGVSTQGATMFSTHRPCYRCCQRLINAGISRVIYEREYGDMLPREIKLITSGKLELEKYIP